MTYSIFSFLKRKKKKKEELKEKEPSTKLSKKQIKNLHKENKILPQKISRAKDLEEYFSTEDFPLGDTKGKKEEYRQVHARQRR